MADQDARDINQMMSSQGEGAAKMAKKPKLIWVVLACVVVGVGLGILVYQQSVKPKPVVKTSPKPAASVMAPSLKPTPNVSPSPKVASPSASVNPANINLIENTNDEDDEGDLFADASASPKASKSPSPKPSASVSPKPSGSVVPSKSPIASKSPSPSPRVVMPDTTGGVPETGVFEITVGTVGVGLLLLVVGLIGLLVL